MARSQIDSGCPWLTVSLLRSETSTIESSFRTNSYADPWKSFVPARVDCVDDAAGGEAVRRGVVARDDRELRDGFRAETESGSRARGGVGVIVDAHAVEAVIVLLRPTAGNRQLRSEPAVSAVVQPVGVRLRTDWADPWLEDGQPSSVAAV